LRSNSRISTVVIFAATVVIATACEIEKVQIPSPPAKVALHSVLSASAPSQVVLLERTRNGSVTVFGTPFDLVDPVVSDHGIAEPDALVRLVTPANDTIAAVEDSKVRDDQKGAGIYRFAIDGAALQRGGTYHLIVNTTHGELLTARTVVPDGVPAMASVGRTFDRTGDTVTLDWPAVVGARAYWVRIETPFGPRFFFTDSTHVRLTGNLRNTQATGLPHVFIPGFLQPVTVSAVDSNYYDWYRTHNNSVSGEGLIDRVDGGLGVFGSLVRLTFESWNITAPQDKPGGVYRMIGQPIDFAAMPFYRLDLYLEGQSARSDQPDALTGRYYRSLKIGEVGCPMCGVLGTIKNGEVRLALLSDWFAQDTLEQFVGELRGDTLIGNYRFTGPVTFVRDH
jgi:hypothetical protein